MGMNNGRSIKRVMVECTRTTISIPLKIKKRMNKFQKRNEVNWSKIATKAFKKYMEANNGEG